MITEGRFPTIQLLIGHQVFQVLRSPIYLDNMGPLTPVLQVKVFSGGHTQDLTKRWSSLFSALSIDVYEYNGHSQKLENPSK